MDREGLKRVLLSWSSGKDSAWALHRLRQRRDVEVVALLTTFNQSADRVAMHAVRRELVRMQAERAGLPLLFRGDTLVAVADLFVDDAHALTREYEPERQQRGPLYAFQAMQL